MPATSASSSSQSGRPAALHLGKHTFLVERPKKAFQFVDHTERKDAQVKRRIRINAGRHVSREKIKAENGPESKPARSPQDDLCSDELTADTPEDSLTAITTWISVHEAELKKRDRRKQRLTQSPDKRFASSEYESEIVSEEQQSPDLATRSSNFILHVGSAFNPFDSMPAHCTAIDKFLLRQYFDVLPERLYGIRKDAAFNPQRDLIFPQSYRHPAIFQWVLVSVSSFYTACGGQLDPSYTSRARSNAYRLINEGLDDLAQHQSDELLGAITSAVMVESRYGDPSVTSVHLEGLRTFLDRRGGIESLVGKDWYPVVVQALHLSGSGLGAIKSVRDVAELRSQTDVVVQTLLNMQRFDLQYQRSRLEHEQAELERKLLPCSSPTSPRSARLFSMYAETRRKSFSPGSPLYTILSNMYLKYKMLPYVLQHCFLAVLLSLNLALLDYNQDLRGGIQFLNALVCRLQDNGIFVKGAIVANIETLNLFLVTGGLDGNGEGETWNDREFRRKWAVIDAMRVIARLTSQTRDTVQEALYTFLVDGLADVTLQHGPRLDENTLGNIRLEVLAGLVDACVTGLVTCLDE